MGGVMDETGMLAKASAAADALRAAGGTVLFAPITFKEDGSDNPNKGIGILAGCANDKLFTEGTWNAEFCKEFSPQEGDSVVVGKRGLDAFPNTNLEELLIAKGIETVVLCGFLTNCCVESTMRTAFEKGFNTVTLTDCCATTSADGQKAATEGTFTMFSTPMSADDFTAKLKPAPAKPAAGKKVLIVLTSVDKYPDGSPTGWYLPEAVHPYYKFVEAGCDVEFASISGKPRATLPPSTRARRTSRAWTSGTTLSSRRPPNLPRSLQTAMRPRTTPFSLRVALVSCGTFPRAARRRRSLRRSTVRASLLGPSAMVRSSLPTSRSTVCRCCRARSVPASPTARRMR